MSAHHELHRPGFNRRRRQIFCAEIRDDVAEVVHAQHNAFYRAIDRLRFRHRKFLVVRNFVPHRSCLRPFR